MALMMPRRAVLGAGLALLAAPAEAAVPRIATTELVLTETALALGLVPVAAGNLPLYRRLVGTPELPAATADLGPLNEPNMELLAWLKPDLIIAADWQSAPQAGLQRIAPVHWLATLPMVHPPLDTLHQLSAQIGQLCGRSAEARHLSEEFAQLLSGAVGRGKEPSRPVIAARVMEDGRSALVFAKGSMVGDVMAALGMPNAIPDAGPFGAMPLPLGDLLALQAPVVTLGPVPGGTLLSRLVAQGRIRTAEIAPIFPAGGLPSAIRLARALPEAAARLT